MPWKLCAGHGAADVGPPRPRSCGHVATKTLNQCVFERHAAVRHERAVPAYGSFLFRDDQVLKPSPTGTSPCSHGAETCLDDAMSMEATLMPPKANSRDKKKKKKKKKTTTTTTALRFHKAHFGHRPQGARVPPMIPETCWRRHPSPWNNWE